MKRTQNSTLQQYTQYAYVLRFAPKWTKHNIQSKGPFVRDRVGLEEIKISSLQDQKCHPVPVQNVPCKIK